MNFEKWLEIGKASKTIYQAIVDEIVTSKYNKSSKEMRWLRSAEKSMIKVKDKLDNLVFEQYPDKPTQELVNVFYGPNEDIKRKSRRASERGKNTT